MSNIKLSINPTMTRVLSNLNSEIMKMTEKLIKVQTGLIETYLKEYCNVKGISEDALKDELEIVRTAPPVNSLVVVKVGQRENPEIGVRYIHSGKPESPCFQIFGKVVSEIESFPETKLFIDNIEDNLNDTK